MCQDRGGGIATVIQKYLTTFRGAAHRSLDARSCSLIWTLRISWDCSCSTSNFPVWVYWFHFWNDGGDPQTYGLTGLQPAFSRIGIWWGFKSTCSPWWLWAYSKSSRSQHGTVVTDLVFLWEMWLYDLKLGKLLVSPLSWLDHDLITMGLSPATIHCREAESIRLFAPNLMNPNRFQSELGLIPDSLLHSPSEVLAAT